MTGPPEVDPDTALPPIQREMRGLWIATVANIDWPSRSGLSADAQRAELVDIMERAAGTGFNAIVFHVRPASDAVYRSALEPWGAMLTGTQGGDPGYDPLAFAVQEAHARGMELHAWINPFRAGNASDSVRFSPTHLFHTRRDLVRVYGAQLWLDPGEPAVHDHVMRVVRDIVERASGSRAASSRSRRGSRSRTGYACSSRTTLTATTGTASWARSLSAC